MMGGVDGWCWWVAMRVVLLGGVDGRRWWVLLGGVRGGVDGWCRWVVFTGGLGGWR